MNERDGSTGGEHRFVAIESVDIIQMPQSKASAKGSKVVAEPSTGRRRLEFFGVAAAGTQAKCSLAPISMPAAWGLIASQPCSTDIFCFFFLDFGVLLFMFV